MGYGPDTGPVLGIVREGSVKGFDPETGQITVKLIGANSDWSDNTQEMTLPASWIGPSGEFSGGYPVNGAPVWCVMGTGGRWAALGYARPDDAFGSRNTANLSGYERNIMETLDSGDAKWARWLTQVRNNVMIMADPKIGVRVGDPTYFLQADPQRNILSTNFEQNMYFTEAHHHVIGPIRRDLISTPFSKPNDDPLTSHEYQVDRLKTMVGLDPELKPGDSIARNPALVESREMIYEFERSFGFTNDKKENEAFGTNNRPLFPSTFQRTDSRADTLNLSLLYPNHLIETTKGTVVDFYGNIIDLNRFILPSGQLDSLSLSAQAEEATGITTYWSLREQLRKSLAYHFEINARKDVELPDLDDTSDYARARSRFFFDVDKEGQFKLNVPSSSEVGNIGLLTRYENYSAIEAEQAGIEDPNRYVQNKESNQDIYIEEFGAGRISLNSKSEELLAFTGPTDRTTGTKVKLGTAFHGLTDGLALHRERKDDQGNVLDPVLRYPDSKLNDVAPIETIVTDEIIVSGTNANAGGRSGTISLDGSLSMSIGANTIDRQSLWLDCAGGIVGNIGRDLRDVSAACTFDGSVLIQIGSSTINNDSRYKNEDNGMINGILDIRVQCNAMMHIFRIYDQGVRVHSAGEVSIDSDQSIRINSVRGDVYIDGESVFVNSRLINRRPKRTVS